MPNPIETWTQAIYHAAGDYALAVRRHDECVRQYEDDRAPQIDVHDSQIKLAQTRARLRAVIREGLIEAYATGSRAAA